MGTKVISHPQYYTKSLPLHTLISTYYCRFYFLKLAHILDYTQNVRSVNSDSEINILLWYKSPANLRNLKMPYFIPKIRLFSIIYV